MKIGRSLVRSRPLSGQDCFKPDRRRRKRYFKASNSQAGFGRLKLRILREEVIAELGPRDVFRNQFRAGRDAPRCGLQVIDWGLQHIERLRKANSDAREEKVRRWTTIVIPVLSLLVAFLSVGATMYMQYQNLQTQSANSMYQITIQPKQANYASLMSSLFGAYEAAIAPDQARMYTSINEIEKSIYALEPFLEERHIE